MPRGRWRKTEGPGDRGTGTEGERATSVASPVTDEHGVLFHRSENAGKSEDRTSDERILFPPSDRS
jgi:hypothetical protein